MGKDCERLVAKYPTSTLGYDVTNLDPEQWAKESHNVSANTVYNNVESGKALSSQYVTDAVEAAEKRIVAGGYRLANLMKSVKFAGPSAEPVFLY